MGAFILLLVVLLLLGGGGFFFWRRTLRYAKSIERGLKMVPVLIDLPPPSDDSEVGGRDVRDVIQEKISQAETLYNLIASTAKSGFKSNFYGQRHIGFEIIAVNGVIRFFAAVPVALVPVVKQAVQTAYPNAQLEEVEDHNIFNPAGKITGTIGGEIKLKKEYAYPIATFSQLKHDSMQALINGLASLEVGDGAAVQILMRPAKDGWMKSAQSLAGKLRKDKGKGGFDWKELASAPFKAPEEGDSKPEDKQLSNLEQSVIDSIEEKTKHPGYEVLIRVVASSTTASRSQAILSGLTSSFALFDSQGLNGFKFEEAKNIEKFVTAFIFRFFPPGEHKMILNSVELATLFHFPEAQFTHTSQVVRQTSKQVDGPAKLAENGLLLGFNLYRGIKKEIRLSYEDRRRHTYIVGQTGTGKSTLLESLAVQDMLDGHGFAFIDPHGDAAEKMLGLVPKSRAEDVIYFNPGDTDHPLGVNLFEAKTTEEKDFVIQEAINMLYRLYDPGHTGIIGPRYEHLFRNAALTVMADPEGGSFIDIPKLFRDPQYVKEKLKHVQDQTVREFWQKEMPASQRSNDFGEVVSWFVSKFGAFLSNEMMRNIIGQTESSFNLREIMDNKKILVVNLSKGRVGELNSMLLGMIFITKFQAAAMSRATLPEDQRTDFCLYVDEFQNFSTDSFATILSEARKYRLNLIVANQFIGQLSEEIREAVFGNVGTIISFRAGPNDADFLVKQFAPAFDARDLVNLPNFNAVIRMIISGSPSHPFSLTTMPPIGIENPQLAAALRQLSAAKYGKPKQAVEAAINKRFATRSPFDTPAGSPGGPRPLNPGAPPPGAAGAAGSSSFLDEWLAKRRQGAAAGLQQNSPPPRPEAAAARPQTGAPAAATARTSPDRPAPPPTPDKEPARRPADFAGSSAPQAERPWPSPPSEPEAGSTNAQPRPPAAPKFPEPSPAPAAAARTSSDRQPAAQSAPTPPAQPNNETVNRSQPAQAARPSDNEAANPPLPTQAARPSDNETASPPQPTQAASSPDVATKARPDGTEPDTGQNQAESKPPPEEPGSGGGGEIAVDEDGNIVRK